MKPFLEIRDFAVTGEKFVLHKDEELQMLITSPHPENLDIYYDSDDYISHTDASKSLSDKIYQLVKTFNIWMKIRLIERHAKNNRSLLDVGAGTGDFLLAARKRGWLVTGVEPNRYARLRSSEKRMDLLADIDALPRQKFQVITLWHVLEHLPDLENQIAKFQSHLEDDGTLIIAVPNFNSYDATYYGEFWAAYDVPRHLWHFSRESIEKLFSRHDMEVVATRPMVFDSFYVSLLSEKFKTGRENYFKALGVGLVSNLKGWSTKEYSSIIYILRKKE